VLPALLGVVMTFLMHNPSYLMMAFMSPVMMLGSWANGRRQGKVGHRRKPADYHDQLAATEREIAEAGEPGRGERRAAAPDAAELLLVATGPRTRLWERRRSDPDHLVVRVGPAELAGDITVEELDAGQRGSAAHTVPEPVRDRLPLDGFGPQHQGGHRRLAGRAVRARPGRARPARPGRRDHRLR
jgi:DNA segregation ATPase FtsK/SpoIIIE, S-DNA-T family